MKSLLMLTIAVLVAGAVSLPAVAADQPSPTPNDTEAPAPQKTTREDVRKEVREAIDAIKSYSSDKRDKAVDKAKAILDDFDARMEKAEQRAEEQKEKAIATRKEKREQVAKSYEEMKNATKETWEKAKSGFLKEYREMEEEYEEKVVPFMAKGENHDDASRTTAEGK